MLISLKRKIESFLYHKGFTDPTLRGIMLIQLFLGACFLVAGLALIWLTGWILAVFTGVAVVAFNFWFLCRFIFKYFHRGFSRELLLGQLAGFFGRFLLTAGVLAVVFVLGGSPVAVSAGLLLSVASGGVMAVKGLRGQGV